MKKEDPEKSLSIMHRLPAAEEPFGELEKRLREFYFYHGFLPREDLKYVLKVSGDYLLRVSEIDEANGKIRREVILSLVPVDNKENKDKDGKSEGKIEVNGKMNSSARTKQIYRNVIVKRHGLHFYVEKTRSFETIGELIDYYKANMGHVNSISFLLKCPIPLQSWEFLHNEVTLGNILGAGAFGEVHAGKLKTSAGSVYDVAVKVTKGAAVLNKQKIKEMMNEARFMRNFTHKNVVRMHGVAVNEQPIYILLELVKGGSLSSYLIKNKGNVTVQEKIKMCSGAAQGLEYLHANGCIHRDIAARNLLYASNDKLAKISDFGLSRSGPHYKPKSACKVAIKWLAPETIVTLSFTYSTDVYSYGVMIYEVFTDGAEPWEGLSNSDVKVNVCTGRFLKLPESSPESVKNVVKKIFVKENRIAMPEVVKLIEAASLEAQQKLETLQKTEPLPKARTPPAGRPMRKSPPCVSVYCTDIVTPKVERKKKSLF
ncbi:unnamed protein product [Caenorhabditis auriculariae]|uniref:Tyrosine-protein kinase n=1 Tax=Caenorhabditis auriculariae TaxID=2777116 RepID=A0A8S1HKJ4_9PELO|nr:unnamed protein product [Caenorhabditis auriculariae]